MTMLIVAMLSIALPLFLIFCRVAVVVFTLVLYVVLYPAAALFAFARHYWKSKRNR